MKRIIVLGGSRRSITVLQTALATLTITDASASTVTPKTFVIRAAPKVSEISFTDGRRKKAKANASVQHGGYES